MTWNGEERRKNGQRDHDLLITIHEIVKSNAKAFEEHRQVTQKHFDDDIINFDKVHSRINKSERFQSQITTGILVAFSAIEIVSWFFKSR